MKKYSDTLGFVAATVSFLMVFAASATPIPLYDIYHQSEGLTYNDLALTAVVYFIGAITALLIFGRISNHLGRKPVAYLIFFLTAVATIILLDVNSAATVIIGRLLLGLACGLASSALTAFIADNGAQLPHWLPSAVISNSPMVGLTIGALLSGSLVELAPFPRTLCYLVILVILALCTVLIALSQETIGKNPGIIASLKPKLLLPQADKRLFPIVAITFVSTWAMGAFYQAFGPSIAADWLNTHNTVMIALLFASYLLPSALGGPFTAKFTPADVQRVGMGIFTFAVLGIIFSLKYSNITAILLSSALAGTAQGAVLTGSIRSLLADITLEQRAGVFSLIYATSYSGAALTSFIAGQLSHHMDLFHVSLFYLFLAATAFIVVFIYAKNPKHSQSAYEYRSDLK